jgi:ATP-binding cassette, subfamily F, member 3
MLQRMERVEAVAVEKAQGNFQLKKVERTGNQVLSVENLAIGYGEKVLADGIDFSLLRGEALGVIGANGTGKTTFLKTVLGDLPYLAGKILWGAKVDIGYYSQNLEDLHERNEVIQELRRVAPLADNGELRGFLARFLFTGEDVFKRVGDLSGGEKGRLALAKLIYSNKNVLVLDEPTNHLDIPSREALEAALDAYQGTIITVSHDRYFLDRIATQILSFEPDRTVEIFNGNYSEFHEWKLSRESKPKEFEFSNYKSPTEDSESKTENQKPKTDLSKNQLQKVERRIKEIEAEIPLAEEKLAQLTLEMSRPEVAADHAKLQAANEKYSEMETKIQSLYEEWDELSKFLE